MASSISVIVAVAVNVGRMIGLAVVGFTVVDFVGKVVLPDGWVVDEGTGLVCQLRLLQPVMQTVKTNKLTITAIQTGR
jgi:hypothetical protein